MTSRLTEVVVDCHDPRALAQFWCGVLDYHMVYDHGDSITIGPREMGAELAVEALRRAAQPVRIEFLTVPEGKQVKNRLHLDLNPVDQSQAEEVDRVLALGARRVDIGQGERSWVVLADPEGNEFCILHSLAPATGS